MSILGVYPFIVNVANVFDPDQNVGIKVVHHYRPGYCTTSGEGKKIFVIAPIQTKEYTIEGGYRLGFPALMGDEYLEISLDVSDESNTPPDYSIQAGLKAKARFILNGEAKKPKEGTYIKVKDLEDDFYAGGGWEVGEEDNWTLTIKKYGSDPIEENVTIGDVDI